jgi:thymidylate synthase ThyX
MFSRNFQSSRAVPTMKQIKLILKDPALPVHWGTNNAGMSSNVKCGKFKSKIANGFRRFASYCAIGAALFESKVLGIHKQWSNRHLEPFMYTKGVFTTTKKGLSNFLALRQAPDAQPEIKVLADLIYGAYKESVPKLLGPNDWHLPYVTDAEFKNHSIKHCIKISASRAASVSYRPLVANVDKIWPRLGLDGNNPNVHASPAEHQAKLSPNTKGRGGNFGNGWVQFRKTINQEFKGNYLN